MVSYLANLNDIILDYNNSQELQLLPFLQKYHQPAVRISYQSRISEPTLLPDNCSGGVLEDVTNSILDSLVDSANEFVGKFASNLCMTSEQVAQKERDYLSSLESLKDIVGEQNLKNVFLQDPLIANIDRLIKSINNSEDVVKAAWANLFDKMTACGLFNLVTKTIETIAKVDFCGLSPEAILTVAIKSSLKNIDTGVLRRIYEGLPENTKNELLDNYSERFRQFIEDSGYNGSTAAFPWDLEEQNRQAERDSRENRIIYDGPLFTSPSLEQTQSRYVNSYRAGYRAGLEYDPLSEDEEEIDLSSGQFDEGSFWAGYVAARGDVELGIPGDPNSIVPPRRSDVLTDAERLETNSPNVNSSAFGRLAGGLVADTFKISIEIFVETLGDLLSFDELLEQTGDLPVVGALIKSVPEIAKCAVDIKLISNGQELNVGSIQNNLQNGFKGDICDIIGGLKSLTLPDIEAKLNSSLNTRTLKAAFLNALLPVIRNLLIKILLNTLLKIISKTTGVLKGALCEAAKSNISSAIEGSIAGNVATQVYIPPRNIGNLFAEAFCGPSTTPEQAADQAFSTISSLVEGGTPDSSCSLIDSLSRRLRMDQLLDLLQGDASESVVQVVLSISRNDCPEFSDFLFDEASVRSFFVNLSTSFTDEFLNETRDSLETFGANRGDIVTTCDIDPDISGLEQALREECGDNISEEQIQQQIESFRRRVEQTVDDLTSIMSSGFDSSMEDTIQNTLASVVPKDDPTNVILVKQVVDSMFDPLYSSYSRGLLAPVAPNGNCGYLNAVLSNKKAVPLKGQFTAFRALSSLAFGPMSAMLPGGGGAAEEIISSLRMDFFGPDTGERPTEKPGTIGSQLLDVFNNGEYFSFSSDFSNDYIELTYDGPIELPIFNLNYNFITNEASLTRYSALGIERNQDSTTLGPGSMRLVAPESDETFGEVQEYLNNNSSGISPIELARPFFPSLASSPTPLTIGSSVILHNLSSTGVVDPLSPGLYGTNFSSIAVNVASFIKTLRARVLLSLAKSITYNSNAFAYGEYIFDEVSDTQLIPSVDPALTERGYDVFYLDDGNIVVVPPRKGGWLELKDILLPERQSEYCCPDRRDLLDVQSIKSAALSSFESLSEDPRLNENPRTVREAPYAHILGRTTAACMEGVVVATIRTHIIECMLNGYASFSKYKTNIPSAYSDLLADYVSKKMRGGLRTQRPTPQFPASQGTDLYGYWNEFLEQAVQVYINRANSGRITIITAAADAALRSISSFSAQYRYPQRGDLREARTSRPGITLKKLRRDENIKAIQQTEDEAIVILRHLVKEEFNRISQTIDEIFPTPGGGWVSNIGIDFLKNGYYIENRNVFDIPMFDEDILDGLRNPDLSFEEKGHFILQSYVRPVLVGDPTGLSGPERDFYERMQSRTSTASLFGLREMRGIYPRRCICLSTVGIPTDKLYIFVF